MEQDGQNFTARLIRWKGEKVEKLTLGEEGNALAAKADVEAGQFKVESVENRPLTRNPPPPFTTSTLQQEAARKLGFSASHTMRIAQQLYEDGAIRSEEHTSELQSLMRPSYAVFCLQKKQKINNTSYINA